MQIAGGLAQSKGSPFHRHLADMDIDDKVSDTKTTTDAVPVQDAAAVIVAVAPPQPPIEQAAPRNVPPPFLPPPLFVPPPPLPPTSTSTSNLPVAASAAAVAAAAAVVGVVIPPPILTVPPVSKTADVSVVQVKRVFPVHSSSHQPLTLCINKIPPNTIDVVLTSLFEACGKVKKWNRPLDYLKNTPKDFGFVTFEHAVSALRFRNAMTLIAATPESGFGDIQILVGKQAKAALKVLSDFERDAVAKSILDEVPLSLESIEAPIVDKMVRRDAVK